MKPLRKSKHIFRRIYRQCKPTNTRVESYAAYPAIKKILPKSVVNDDSSESFDASSGKLDKKEKEAELIYAGKKETLHKSEKNCIFFDNRKAAHTCSTRFRSLFNGWYYFCKLVKK